MKNYSMVCWALWSPKYGIRQWCIHRTRKEVIEHGPEGGMGCGEYNSNTPEKRWKIMRSRGWEARKVTVTVKP